MKTLSPDDARRPQLAVTSVGKDPIGPHDDLYMDVYTGFLSVGHFAGQNPSNEDIQFPLVYILNAPGSRLGIRPIADKTEFRAAVVHASITGFVDKTDPAIVHILSARTDLREVRLHPGTDVLAVVLTATVKAQNAELHDVGYQVTVLRRVSPKTRILDPIEVGSANWDGKYDKIGKIVRAGAPQHG
jgi:hypothetical protein